LCEADRLGEKISGTKFVGASSSFIVAIGSRIGEALLVASRSCGPSICGMLMSDRIRISVARRPCTLPRFIGFG
jgi:hypothetical protein